MECCFSGEQSVNSARIACRDTLYDSVTAQLVDQSTLPVLIDAIPTIGKTSAAAQFAAELCEGDADTQLTYLTHRTANRDQFENMVRSYVNDNSVVDLTHLPVLEDDCPTAQGTHGEAWQSRLLTLRNQGLSPSSLHRNETLDLPCGGRECSYMDWWTEEDTTDLIIGHLSHAYVPEVIDDRIVIVDEDPGDAFQTRFDASDLHRLTREFLTGLEAPPASDLDSLKLLRQGGPAFEDARETLLEKARETDRFELGQDVLEGGRGHVGAANIVQALLEPEVDDRADREMYRTILENDVEHARLSDSTVAAYDPDSGELALRETPDFDNAAALVGLDGTPTTTLWKGRLGVDELDHVQVLCNECRQTYLEDILGYHLIQTSPYLKPYSGASAKRISFRKDRGLLHEVERRTDGLIGLITTKRVRDPLLEHDDENQISISRDYVNHYRNIKGSNEFAGDDVQVGVIIGSPHPGPNELRLLAGLNEDAFETEVVEESRDGHHYSRREPTDEAEPYLRHVRDHSVAQAVLRFGRQDGATVFIHTAALPEWMQSLCDEALLRRRSEGEQAVIQVLSEVGKATTTEIAERTDFVADTVRNQLKSLEAEGVVVREGNSHRIIWSPTEAIDEVSPTACIDWPEGFRQQ